MTKFVEWEKTTRLHSPVVVTEKLDGINGAVIVERLDEDISVDNINNSFMHNTTGELFIFDVSAQTRSRLVYPGEDSTGFAHWVAERADQLAVDLGVSPVDGSPAHHFGEFMKKGLKAPKFYLFNTGRWAGVEFNTPDLDVVPVLYEGDYYEGLAEEVLEDLRKNGSRVHPGIPAEGVCIFWRHNQTIMKAFTGLLKKNKV